MSNYLPTQPKKRPPGGAGQSLLPEEVRNNAVHSSPGRARPVWRGEGPKPSAGLNRQGRTILAMLVLCILSYYLFSRFVVTAVVVQGRSMAPTLEDGGRYLLNRMTLWFREPRRGDLVVIRDSFHDDSAVKRIVGLPGEAVEVRAGQVFVDGHPLKEPYLPPHIHTYSPDWSGLAVKLREDQYFVMGDNRPSSEDSRSYGPLSRGQIVGLLVK